MVSAILPDTCFYDIGASIGLHSLVAGQRLAAAGEIHAFEPDLPSCAVYWSNMELVRRRVKVHLSKTFVSDISTLDDTEALCLFPIELTGASQSLGQGRHLYLFEEGTNRLIPRVSIDAYVRAGARPPSVIKCDIEGAELLFLRGAVETLRLLKPALFVSLHPALIGHFGYGEKEFFDFLRSLNYSWEILNSVGECHVFANASKNESNGNQCVK
jgi:FkbM family methyltransferase